MKSRKFLSKILSLILSLTILSAAFPNAFGTLADAQGLPKIWLDAGHGGSDPGATNGSRHEADDNLRVALAVGSKLESAGFEVGYTRTGDVAVDLDARVPMAANWGADFVVSIHRNSASPAATGLETFYHFKENTDSTAYKLASAIQTKVQQATGYVNRGTKADGDPNSGDIGLCITRNSWERGIAGALVEIGFISNDSDNAVFDSNFDQITSAIANAVSETAGNGELSQSVAPYMENGELWLADCNALEGWTTEFGTTIYPENDSRGLTSMCMTNDDNCQNNNASVGLMAFMRYSSGCSADVTPFNHIRFSMWCEIDYATSSRTEDYFQVNFITEGQDGYNLNIPASSLRQGWNNDFVFAISDIPKAVDSADWSNITGMRFTWFNVSNGQGVEFNIDNFVCYYAEDVTVMSTCERDTEDVFDFCQNAHGTEEGGLSMNPTAISDTYPGIDRIYNAFYCRAGRNYGDDDYTRSFNYTKYYQFEALIKPENDNTLVISHGNEQNNMEWQFPSSVNVTGGKWQRAEIKISDIAGSAAQGDVSIGLYDVNLLHFAQTQSGRFIIKNIALVTSEYANERQTAVNKFIDAVNAIGTVNSQSQNAISLAVSLRQEAESFINVKTDEFLANSELLDRAVKEFEQIGKTHTVSLEIFKDSAVWNNCGKAFTLGSIQPEQAGGTTFKVEKGRYEIFEDGNSTKIFLEVTGDMTPRIDYYTLSFSAIDTSVRTQSYIEAKCNGKTVNNRDALLAGSRVELTVKPAGTALYAFEWSEGQEGETVVLDVNSPINAECLVTGADTGDVDLDGEISVGDALKALQAAVSKIELEGISFKAADIGAKGKITVGDALLILQVSVNKIPHESIII